MKRIDRLKGEAKQAAETRLHTMTPFHTLKGRNIATSVCTRCKMQMAVNSHPAPNEIDVGGEAVAMNCPVTGFHNRSLSWFIFHLPARACAEMNDPRMKAWIQRQLGA